jgi:hypothetical protein
MINKKTIIIAGTSIIVLGILYFAYKKKKFNEDNDILTDVDFQNVLKKVDEAEK